MISDRFLESRVWDTVAWAWLSQAGGIQSNSTHFNICHLILFIVTNTFSIIMWRQNRLDMYRNNYVAKKAEYFLVPYYLLLLGKMMSCPDSSWSWCHVMVELLRRTGNKYYGSSSCRYVMHLSMSSRQALKPPGKNVKSNITEIPRPGNDLWSRARTKIQKSLPPGQQDNSNALPPTTTTTTLYSLLYSLYTFKYGKKN